MIKETFEQTLDVIRGQEKYGNITIETIEGCGYSFGRHSELGSRQPAL